MSKYILTVDDDEITEVQKYVDEVYKEAYRRGFLDGYELGARLQTPITKGDPTVGVPPCTISCDDVSPITYIEGDCRETERR